MAGLGRICMHRKKINISTAPAGQSLGIKEVDDGIWLVSFFNYDLGFFDKQHGRVEPAPNPFAPDPARPEPAGEGACASCPTRCPGGSVRRLVPVLDPRERLLE